MAIADNDWRKDTLPFEKIFVPDDKLPDAEADNGDVQLTLNEMVGLLIMIVNSDRLTSFMFTLGLQPPPHHHKSFQEQKWSDLALSTLAPDIATISDQLNVNAV